MKRILSFILAVIMLLSCAVFAGAAEKGDVDGDGTTTAADARLALRCAVNLEKLSDAKNRVADVDGNGKVEVDDSLMILQYVAEIIDSCN